MQTAPLDFRPPTDDAPTVFPPATPTLFAERAERFAALAAGHSLGDWLNFLADLTRAQHAALQALPELPLPDDASIAQSREYQMPPLNAASVALPAVWREVLTQLIAQLLPQAPANAAAALESLRRRPATELDVIARALLAGEPEAEMAADLPWVAAALQVVWTRLAASLGGRHPDKLDSPGVCPCCGSLAVASVLRLSPTINNLRYLHCSLCNTEWNIPRAVCTACGSDQKLSYRQLETSDGQAASAAVRAETCDHCHSYLKLGLQEKDPRFDPVADDLATLALDLLVDEAGYSRSGPNWLLVGGSDAD